MSSSRGTRSTDGILLGSISRALLSTSFPESPTGNQSLIYYGDIFPGIFRHQLAEVVDNPRSSLSIVFSFCSRYAFDA